MKTWIKRISIGVAVALALAVAGLAVFLLTFDPNAYKDHLQAWVQERYHRTLTIDGDIEATLFPRLGLTPRRAFRCRNRTARNPSRPWRPHACRWRSGRCCRAISLSITRASAASRRVVRDKQGRLNFQDLLGGEPAGQDRPTPRDTQADARPGAAPRIDIAGLDIKDGEVQLQDDANGRALAISQLNAKTGRVRIDEPFDASLSAHIQGATPGSMPISPARRPCA